MDINYGNIIISESTCGCSSIHTVTAHHRRYPEIAVEAVSAARAVEHLERLLLRARLRYGQMAARGVGAGGCGCSTVRLDATRGAGFFARSSGTTPGMHVRSTRLTWRTRSGGRTGSLPSGRAASAIERQLADPWSPGGGGRRRGRLPRGSRSRQVRVGRYSAQSGTRR